MSRLDRRGSAVPICLDGIRSEASWWVFRILAFSLSSHMVGREPEAEIKYAHHYLRGIIAILSGFADGSPP